MGQRNKCDYFLQLLIQLLQKNGVQKIVIDYFAWTGIKYSPFNFDFAIQMAKMCNSTGRGAYEIYDFINHYDIKGNQVDTVSFAFLY